MRLINLKTKNWLYFLSLEKIDGSFCWYSHYVSKKKDSTVIKQVNPIPRLAKKFRWYRDYLYMFFTKQLYKRCQGCGEGIAIWKIRNPNYGHGNEYFNCCKDCVSFYDIRWSKRKIKWEK